MRFGMIAMVAGLIGVPLGSFIAQRQRATNPECDPVICGYGALISAPFVYLVLITAGHSSGVSFFFVFIAMVALNTCWSLVADMLLVRRGGGEEMERSLWRTIGGSWMDNGWNRNCNFSFRPFN